MNETIVCDTSCLIALEHLELLDILKSVYGTIIITREVKEEYGKSLPEWIYVYEVNNKEKQSEIESRLDKGEASSIALSLEIYNVQLIIDDHKGRKFAKSLQLNIIGTIGILVLAYKKGVIQDIKGILHELINSGFRISKDLIQKIIDEYGLE